MLASACFSAAGASVHAAQCPSQEPRSSRALFQAVNATRVASGLAPLERSRAVTRPARTHSLAMATAGRLWHDLSTWARGHAGQNVGGGSTSGQVYRAMLSSAPHRAAILDPSYRRMGVSAARACNGGLMVTVNFTG